MSHPLHGLMTALVTPFKNDEIDFTSLQKLLDYQKKGGVKTVVVAGSTGEVPTLSKEEYNELIKHAVEFAGGLNIVAGCGSSSTKIAVDMATSAEKIGASALMCTVPAYNKPTQEGIWLHFKAVHDATNLPIMLYTIPSRTGTDFTDETILRLAQLPRIVAIKDGGPDIERPLRMSAKLSDFSILAGDDSAATLFYAQGGSGLVSVASNVMPRTMSRLCALLQESRLQEAITLQQKLFPMYKAMFIETNPIPVKYAVSLLGLCEPDLRMPLCALSKDNQEKVEIAMKIAKELEDLPWD
ncbi:MAG: 4-hydroxy-tetrahydrodipicolinate synthase [Pseudomonadota bacterium]